jgi:hypothetical protein
VFLKVGYWIVPGTNGELVDLDIEVDVGVFVNVADGEGGWIKYEAVLGQFQSTVKSRTFR